MKEITRMTSWLWWMFPDERETPYDNRPRGRVKDSCFAMLRCCLSESLKLRVSPLSLWEERIPSRMEESGMILLCLAVAVEFLLFFSFFVLWPRTERTIAEWEEKWGYDFLFLQVTREMKRREGKSGQSLLVALWCGWIGSGGLLGIVTQSNEKLHFLPSHAAEMRADDKLGSCKMCWQSWAKKVIPKFHKHMWGDVSAVSFTDK